MSQEVYEYKDSQNWFIGTWGEAPSLTALGGDYSKKLSDVNQLFSRLQNGESTRGAYQIVVVRQSSHLRLLTFVSDLINQHTHRQLTIRQHKGAYLVIEKSQLLGVYLPKNGIPMESFFGTDTEDTLLIATRNEGKTKEFRAFFGALGYRVENLNAYPDLPEVAETGTTFEENARLKAETIANLTGKMVLADDSGLKVDKLGGLPGVWSARFSGPDATDEQNNTKLLHELTMVFDQADRSAQFHCTLVVAAPNCESLVVSAEWLGYIATVPRGESGFGYDPLFLVGETGKTAAELSLEEKNRLSHRAKALEKLMEEFPAWREKQTQSLS